VLQALGLPSGVVEGALRIGIGKFTTDEEIDQAAEILANAVFQIRKLM
jgi:cysteine desulfurase